MLFHTLVWPDVDSKMLRAHESVAKHLGYSVKHYSLHMRHGDFMDKVCKEEFESGSEIVCFMDIDCIVTDHELPAKAYRWVKDNRGILGIAQSSNHLDYTHIFAAPAFYMIHRDAWKRISFTFLEDSNNDVAQAITRLAERMGIPVRTLYPTGFLFHPDNEHWRLGNYGVYGRATKFDHGVFHLYQGRMNNAVNTFVDVCNKVIDGTYEKITSWFECTKL